MITILLTLSSSFSHFYSFYIYDIIAFSPIASITSTHNKLFGKLVKIGTSLSCKQLWSISGFIVFIS